MNKDVALTCAALAELAYSDVQADDKELERLGLRLVQVIEHGPSYAFLATDDERLYCAVRGTNDWKDLFLDLRFIKTWFHRMRGRVHRGFKEAYGLIRDDLLEALATTHPDLPLVFGAHSLGAAIVQEAAAECCSGFYLDDGISWMRKPEILHLFGSPRVGNSAFVELITCECIRWKGWFDFVTMVPFKYFGIIQAITALLQGRMPSFYRSPGISKRLWKLGHMMGSTRAAMERRFGS